MSVSLRLAEVVNGSKRARLVPTLVLAAAVTAMVAIPMTIRAVDARGAEPALAAGADPSQLIVDAPDSEPGPLDTATITGTVLISFQNPDASGVSFNLFARGDDQPLLTSQDVVGPQFDLMTDTRGLAVPLDSNELADGDYELFVTVASPRGEQRTAVTFSVVNS